MSAPTREQAVSMGRDFGNFAAVQLAGNPAVQVQPGTHEKEFAALQGRVGG